MTLSVNNPPLGRERHRVSFRDLVEKAGSFKALFDSAKAGGEDIEGQLQQAFENDRIFRYAGFRVVRAESGIVELSFP